MKLIKFLLFSEKYMLYTSKIRKKYVAKVL